MNIEPQAAANFVAPARRIGRLKRPDCEIYFEVTGSGPAIVFMHGLGGNHLSWWQQVAHFAPRFTCVTFAHRGFPPSSTLPGGPDPGAYADDLAALVDHLQLDRFHLVGQSMGGWSAVEYALRKTGKVKGVVLANTTGSLDIRQLREPEKSMVVAWQAAADKTGADGFANGVHPAAGARMAQEQPSLHLLYRHIDDMGAQMDKLGLRQRLGQMRIRPPQDLASTACPVLFLIGAEDIVIPPFAATAIAAVAPNARVVFIPKAGHSAYFERAAQFNHHLETFVSS